MITIVSNGASLAKICLVKQKLQMNKYLLSQAIKIESFLVETHCQSPQNQNWKAGVKSTRV